MPKLYRPNRGDREILRLGREVDPNYITDFYLRSPDSGTWWLPGAQTAKWKTGYKKLYELWQSIHEPEKFSFAGNDYEIRWEHEKAADYPGEPAFFHNHGMLFLPYQKELHQDRTPVRTIIGGLTVAPQHGDMLMKMP